jgi:hypothetical protein
MENPPNAVANKSLHDAKPDRRSRDTQQRRDGRAREARKESEGKLHATPR